MRLIATLLMLFFLFGIAPGASAQENTQAETPKVVIDKSKLLGRPKNADGTPVVTAFTDSPTQWMREKQQRFYSAMNASLRKIKTGSYASAGWTLFIMSFLYGVFHAAGPGHGKAVISGWLLATENELRRGILIAFMSAIIQALTAIVIVSALLLLVRSTAQIARNTADFLESASYIMIAGMGAYLIWNSWRGHSHATKSPEEKSIVTKQVEGPNFELVSRPDARDKHHVHDENCGCGHAHAPAAADVKGDWSLARAFSLAFSVGIRPCSGALLVLFFAYPLGLYAVGVASVIAMGFGVFLTIALIATLTVYAKTWALALAGADNPLLGLATKWGKTVVGFAIAMLGLWLFSASLGGSNISL
jgi:nickel/cobalt transporter (NicO) family protein